MDPERKRVEGIGRGPGGSVQNQIANSVTHPALQNRVVLKFIFPPNQWIGFWGKETFSQRRFELTNVENRTKARTGPDPLEL